MLYKELHIYVISRLRVNVEEMTYYVYDVGEVKTQMLDKPPGYFDFLSFSRPMARRPATDYHDASFLVFMP
jgi:hypothetical protein